MEWSWSVILDYIAMPAQVILKLNRASLVFHAETVLKVFLVQVPTRSPTGDQTRPSDYSPQG